MLKRRQWAGLLTLMVASFAACSSEESNQGTGSRTPDTGDGGLADPNAIPFEPVGPTVYVPKVKNLLTGLAPTESEVQAVIKDPNALKGLIDTWMTLPSFKVRMLDFFRNAFQQNQVDVNVLMTNLNVNFQINETLSSPQLARNLMDSFPLTAWKMLEDSRPFNETMTTRRIMMTTAMLSTLSYLDEIKVDDARRTTNRLAARSALSGYTFDSASLATSDESLDPASPNYMKFKYTGAQPTGCLTTSQDFNPTLSDGKPDGGFYSRLFGFFMGKSSFTPCPLPPGANVGQNRITPQYRDTDWADWHEVELKVDPAAPGASPAFYELSKLRTATEITLHTDRPGFFGTLAFATNWGTNVTNESRVTANQALIVALGQSIAGEDTIANFPVDATEAAHSSDPGCQGCHKQLDPFKQFFRQSYTLYYSQQSDTKEISAPAGFNIGGAADTGNGVGDLAQIFAKNPRFALAWVAKLHFWANSTAVIEADPEALRIAEAFKASSYNFKTLVRELFSSPLVTWAAPTMTTSTNGVIVSIARRDQFCASLSNRLGLNDVCGMQSIKLSTEQRTIAQRALLLPVDTYYRSFALPSLPTNPDLFFRQSTEAICRLVADQVVDVKLASKYTSADAAGAIDDFVGTVMGLVPSDTRNAPARAILQDNFDAAKAAGATPTDALKATFTLACLSPSSVVVGL